MKKLINSANNPSISFFPKSKLIWVLWFMFSGGAAFSQKKLTILQDYKIGSKYFFEIVKYTNTSSYNKMITKAVATIHKKGTLKLVEFKYLSFDLDFDRKITKEMKDKYSAMTYEGITVFLLLDQNNALIGIDSLDYTTKQIDQMNLKIHSLMKIKDMSAEVFLATMKKSYANQNLMLKNMFSELDLYFGSVGRQYVEGRFDEKASIMESVYCEGFDSHTTTYQIKTDSTDNYTIQSDSKLKKHELEGMLKCLEKFNTAPGDIEVMTKTYYKAYTFQNQLVYAPKSRRVEFVSIKKSKLIKQPAFWIYTSMRLTEVKP